MIATLLRSGEHTGGCLGLLKGQTAHDMDENLELIDEAITCLKNALSSGLPTDVTSIDGGSF